MYLQCSFFYSRITHSAQLSIIFTANKRASLNFLQRALTHFNSSECLSGRSATHQKATLPLLCFQKLLMLLNPFKILREWQIHIQFP